MVNQGNRMLAKVVLFPRLLPSVVSSSAPCPSVRYSLPTVTTRRRRLRREDTTDEGKRGA